MDGEESVIVLLFCGVEDELRNVLGGSLLHAACVAALQSSLLKKFLVIAQPLPAGGGKGVQLQVVYRPGPFDLRAFSQACSKLKPSSDYSDGEFSNEVERALVLTLKLLSGHLGLATDSTPPAIIHVIGRPLYAWTPDLNTIIEYAAKEGTRIFFHTTRDPAKAVTLPTTLLEFGEGILPHDNAHFAAVPADAAAIHELALSWLWPLWAPAPMRLQLYFQQVIGGGTALPCRAVPALQPIAWTSQAAPACACHGLPTAACGAGTSGATLCVATGTALRTADCMLDSSYVRVSDTCLLKLSKDAPNLPGTAAVPDMRFTVLRRAKARSLIPATGPCLTAPAIDDLHEPLLHGIGHALLPDHADGLADESLLSGLAEALYEADEALIARALCNLDTRLAVSVPVFYALLPAVNGTSAWLLARRVACEEEVLVGHLHAEASPGRATDAAKQAAGKLLDRLKCPAFSPLDLHNGFPNTVRRLLDASVPLPQELIQAQKGLPTQDLQAPSPRQRGEAAADQENSGAGQAARGPARAANTRQRKAMHDAGALPGSATAAPSGGAPRPGPKSRRAQPAGPTPKGPARFQQLDVNAHSGAGDQDAKKKKVCLPSLR